jgi:RecJ-like exonuclease
MARLNIKILTSLLTVVVFTSCATVAQETANFFLENNTSTLDLGKPRSKDNNSKKQAKEEEQLKKEDKCPVCKGMGKTPDGMYTCETCKGTGKYNN